MSEIFDKQWLFSLYLARWILEVERRGYRVTLAEVGVQEKRRSRLRVPFRDGVHMGGSLHYRRLAADANLFVFRDGEWVYITDGGDPAWLEMGQFWESLDPEHCAWGGRFGDSNHISVAHDGKK